MEISENSASVRIHALGTFEITAGWILPGRRRIHALKVRELLIGLVAAGARGLGASVLCEALWPESHASEALRALIVTIYRLRRALRCYGAVAFEGGRVALSATRCWVDAWASSRRPSTRWLQGMNSGVRAAQRARAVPRSVVR